MKTEIEQSLREFIAENLLFSEKFPVSDEESLMDNRLIDSTGIMELVGFVSTQFELEVPVRDINQENFDSITRLANYVRRRQQERALQVVQNRPSVATSLPRAELL